MVKKFLIAGTALLFTSYTCIAAPAAKPHAAGVTHTLPKSSHTKNATQSHPAAHASGIKPAAHAEKMHAASALKSKSPASHTHASKSKAHHHQRYAVPQIRPAVLNQELDAAPTTPTPADAVSNKPTEDAPQKPASFLSWFSQGSSASDKENIDSKEDTGSWTHSIAQHLTNAAHKTVATLHYSTYKFGGNHYDPQHGVYMLDCSGYVDNILHQNSPKAYSLLAQSSGSYKPNSENYYNFFNRLMAANGESYNWNKVENTKKLEAGDILVFRYKNSRGGSSGGHVMLVMDKPVVGNAEVLQVRVADSATTGHSADTRGNRASGIGIGTLLLRINPATGQPYAFAWRVGSPWNSRVNIAMGRPPSV